jgi:hypothetical protein
MPNSMIGDVELSSAYNEMAFISVPYRSICPGKMTETVKT